MQRAELPCAVLAGRDRVVLAAGGVFGARVPRGAHLQSGNRIVESWKRGMRRRDGATKQEYAQIRLLYFLILRALQVMKLLVYVRCVPIVFRPDGFDRRAVGAASSPRGNAPPAHEPPSLLASQHRGGIPHFQARGQRDPAVLPAQPDPFFSPLSLSNRLAVLYDVCDRLSSLCGGYFSIGEKLFNQGFILLSRVLEDAFHVDPHQLHVPSSQRIESRPRWTRSRWRFNTSTRTKPRATCRPCSTFSPSKRAS